MDPTTPTAASVGSRASSTGASNANATTSAAGRPQRSVVACSNAAAAAATTSTPEDEENPSIGNVHVDNGEDTMAALLPTALDENLTSDSDTCRTGASNRDDLMSRLVSFWYDDLPPLGGLLRCCFYLSILTVMTFDWNFFRNSHARDTFDASSCKKHVERLFHYTELDFPMKREAGLFGRLVTSSHFSPEKVFNCDLISKALRWGIFLSGIGLGGRLPRAVAAVCWWTIFGISTSTWGKAVHHNAYLPGYAFVSLCFAENNMVDKWSVDSLLGYLVSSLRDGGKVALSKQAHWNRGPSFGGAARKFVLFQTVVAMFCAGLHKVAKWGFTWLDGQTIYSSVRGHRKSARSPLLSSAVLRYPFLARVMAITSVAGEMGSVAALLSPWWRPFGVATFCAFHIGVYLIMPPNFIMQGLTYALLVDWQDLGCRLFRSCPVSISSTATAILQKSRNALPSCMCALPASVEELPDCRENYTASPRHRSSTTCTAMRVGAWVYTSVGGLSLIMSVLFLDYFPFYSWSLYSWHPSEPRAPFTVAKAQNAAYRCVTEPPLNPNCLNLGGTPHHSTIPGHISRELSIVTITKDTSTESSGGCAPGEYSAYVNWKSYSCWPESSDLVKLLRRVQESPKGQQRPKSMPLNTNLKDGLKWRITDSAAASIVEGPSCFEEAYSFRNSTFTDGEQSSVTWSAHPSPLIPSSRLSRKLRTRLSVNRHVGNSSIVAIGIFFRFLDVWEYGGEGREENRHCMLGSSVMNETTTEETLDYIVERRGKIMPHGEWTDVRTGVLIVLFFGLSVYFYWQRKWIINRLLLQSGIRPRQAKFAQKEFPTLAPGGKEYELVNTNSS